MKKGQVYEGIIESVEFPNKGRIYVPEEDRWVVVKNGVPGQKVRFSVNKIRKGKAEGRLLEVVEPSASEIPSACPHFGQCGGCTYQNLPYEEQLAMKNEQVKKMMDEAVMVNISGKASNQVRSDPNTVTRWNSHSEMNTKTDRWHLVCTKEDVVMILLM